MINAFVFGAITGILLSFGFGSVFFALIQKSLDYGYKTGILIAVGVVLGDFLLVGISMAGTSALPRIPNFEFYSRLIAAAILLILSVSQFRQRKLSHKIVNSRGLKSLYFITTGFLLNVLNPVNFFSWIILSSTLKSYRYTYVQEIIFFTTCIAFIFIVEALISVFAHNVKRYFSDSLMLRISRITAFVFAGIAIKLIYDALSLPDVPW